MSYLKDLIGKKQVCLLLWHITITFTTLMPSWENILHFCILKSFYTCPIWFISFWLQFEKPSVRAKVCPLIREKGTFCCRQSRCEICCNIKQTDTFESFVSKKVNNTILLIVIANAWFTFFQVNFVVFSMKVTQLIDSYSGRTTTKVAKATQQIEEHLTKTKTVSINIF